MYPNGKQTMPRVSSPYGQRGAEFHAGVDMTGMTLIHAIEGGKVVHAGHYNDRAGTAVIVDMPGYGNVTIEAAYFHLARVNTRKGANVPEGAAVGVQGATGNARGPHLHLEIRYRRAGKLLRTVDPVAWIRAHKRATLRQGSRGGYVPDLQRRIGVKPDGAFGPITKAALIKAQRRYGLVQDGVCGPRSWTRILFG